LPSSGHWIPEEQPGPLAGLLIKFFNEKPVPPMPNETGSKTSNAIEDLIKTVDNKSLFEPNISKTDNLSTAASLNQTTPVTSANLSTGPIQSPSSNGTLLDEGQLANQVSVSRNGSGESAGTIETQIPPNVSEDSTVGEGAVANQGTPLSEAIEAVSKLFGRNNSG
jgi:hypothetical protein